MEFSQRQTKPVTLLGTILLAFLITMTSSSPMRHQSLPDVTSEEGWLMTSEGAGKSHLMMWMIIEKQLLPRLHALVGSATALLRCTCGEEGVTGAEECLALAASLPSIPGLSDLPSQGVIQSENKKTFIKTLLENGYVSLREVEGVLKEGVTPGGLGQCQTSHRAAHFMDSLQTAAAQYSHVLKSFYQSSVPKSCPTMPVSKEAFGSDRLLAIRLLYSAVHHLNQVSAALEYSVQFSWFSRMTATFGNKGRKFRAKKRSKKNKKNKKSE